MSLASLARYGWSEAELRERPLSWVNELTKDLGQQLRRELADQLSVMGLASVLPHGGDESHSQFTETLEELRRDEDDLSHLLDPNAETDYGALRRFSAEAGGVQTQKEEPHA